MKKRLAVVAALLAASTLLSGCPLDAGNEKKKSSVKGRGVENIAPDGRYKDGDVLTISANAVVETQSDWNFAFDGSVKPPPITPGVMPAIRGWVGYATSRGGIKADHIDITLVLTAKATSVVRDIVLHNTCTEAPYGTLMTIFSSGGDKVDWLYFRLDRQYPRAWNAELPSNSNAAGGADLPELYFNTKSLNISIDDPETVMLSVDSSASKACTFTIEVDYESEGEAYRQEARPVDGSLPLALTPSYEKKFGTTYRIDELALGK